MENESRLKPPPWSRWLPIVRTSPSGKTLFVCLVCGHLSPYPMSECRTVEGGSTLLPAQHTKRDHRWTATWPDSQTCREMEERINETIARTVDESFAFEAVEDALRPLKSRKCGRCHGWGCHVCIGRGTLW